MRIKHPILFLLACLTAFSVFGQDYGSAEFVENKGQWDPQVRFMANASNGGVFLHSNGFTILQHHAQDWQQLTDYIHGHMEETKKAILGERLNLRSHAFRVEFIGANSNPQVVPDKPLYTYNNYFIGSDPSKWAAECKIFQGITLKNVYPGVDVRYYSSNGRLKYDIIAAPGADVSKIALRYNGVDGLKVKNGELVIGTSVGELKELSPYSYQYSDKGKTEVTARYVVKGNEVRFEVKNYDRRQTLVIDPDLVFCSFSGSRADNWGFTATYGPLGSMFGGGIVKENGFPTSPGAFQTSHAGGEWDIGIIKLSPDGRNREYATYIGGSGIEQPHSLIVDGAGNLVVAGRSNSSNYPVTGGADGQIGSGGGYDIVVTKLNASGTALIGSKKIGGTADDGVNINAGRNGTNSLQRNYGDDGRSEVILDGAGNIYLASSTQSDNFPIIGGFQRTFGGGKQDGVVLKLNPNLSALLFSSFLGGTGNDAAYVLSLHPFTNNIYVAGGTESTNMPGNSGGTIGPANHGAIDGFVAMISNDGSQVIENTYIGTAGIDQIYGVQFDRFGYPYVMGQTTGAWPVVNAAWSQSGGKQFIAKLEQNLSAYVYSTVFGTGSALPNISPVAFLVDRCENVYVSGWGGSILPDANFYPSAGTTGLSVTPDAIKSTTDGKDFYFFVLKRNATAQLYGSFFGQNGAATDHVDGGTSRFDRNGVIYQAICANCKTFGPATFPTTPGAWATTNPSQSCNLAMVKIAFNLAGVRSGIQSIIDGKPRDTAGCVPLVVDFRDTVLNAVSYEWQFGDGSPQVATTTPNISHTYSAVGTYRVMLVAIDSASCNIRDTSYLHINVGDLKAELDFNPVKLQPCDLFQYRFDNTSKAPAAHPFGPNSFEWDFGDGTPPVTAGSESVTHRYQAPGTYNVRLILKDSAYCNFPGDTVKQLRVAANVVARFEVPAAGCAPFTAEFVNTSEAGQQFRWDFGDGSTSTDINPVHTYTTPGSYTVTLTAVDSATCNITSTTRSTIVIQGKPKAGFTVSPQPPSVNTAITFTNTASPDAVRFVWLFGDGDSVVTTSRQPVQHEYNSTGTFNACQIAFNEIGCPDTTCLPVQTLIETAVDVPNAFTPLSGDINSLVMVRGFGIAKMKFAIWNRWGQKVFETDNKKNGWDGRFKGVLQPMDVYAYTLEVEFSDGTRTSRKGDITLIR